MTEENPKFLVKVSWSQTDSTNYLVRSSSAVRAKEYVSNYIKYRVNTNFIIDLVQIVDIDLT